jgi:hypothetical protein
MLDYPAGWTCERTVLKFEYYLLSTLPLNEALSARPMAFSSRLPSTTTASRRC